MADKYIPNLPEKDALTATDIFAVDDNTQTYKVTLAKLISSIPGVTGVAANNTGDGILVTMRGQQQPIEIIPHDDSKQNVLTFDAVPTEGSENPVYSGGVYAAAKSILESLAQEASTARDNENALARDIVTALKDIAPYEETDVASQEYTVGRLLIRNNLVLYKVKVAIAPNTSIKPSGQDANVEVATIEDMLHLVKSIEEGGTGATTAAGARTNLGLGTAAEKNFTTSVSENDTDLPTGDAVFTAVKAVQDALDDLGLYIDSAGYLCQRIS